jgi:hypothetical protein
MLADLGQIRQPSWSLISKGAQPMKSLKMFQSMVLALGILFGHFAHPDTLFVDLTLPSACTNYDSATRNCGNGNGRAFNNLDAGLGATVAGDTLFLRSGTYGQLVVQNSGTTGNPIVVEAFSGEVAAIRDSGDVGLWVVGKSNVTIRNLVVTRVLGFGRLQDSTRIAIDGVQFSDITGSGTTGSLKFVRTTESVVSNSSFEGGSDLLLLQDDSNRNIIQTSVFGRAAHSLISIRCSSNNVIRRNEFDNPDQKSMEVYDCEGISDAPVRLDDSSRNLIELNRFYGTAPSSEPHRYNAIQHGGQWTIVRHNVFADNLGGGVNYQYYSDESLYVYGNRLYNNTFYNNRCFAIIGQNGPSNRFYDNRVKNNLLYLNSSCSGGGGQVSIENSSLVILSGNSQVNSDPGFVSASTQNFELVEDSQQIDAGEFVTTAIGSESGVVLTVADASWFYDGFNISGESGDDIRIENTTASARIVSVDYASNTIHLGSALDWNNGDGVHVIYNGSAPDVGAFEAGLGPIRPKPPTNVEVN